LRVNELHVYPHAIAATLDASLQDIAHVQLSTDRLHVDRLSFEGEGGVPRNRP
jgi:hypothetical protein